MIHRVHLVTEGWVESIIAQWVSIILMLTHFGLGVSIIAGGPERFSRPSYQPLIDITHGQVWIWGVLILLSSVLMIIPVRWLNIIGLWVGMAWMFMWAACFAISVATYPTAVATAMIAYTSLGAINAVLLTARVLEKPRRRRG